MSLAGAALGIAAASSSLTAILGLYPSNLPRAQEVSIDYRVLLFTVGLAIATGIIFGLVPALQVAKPNLSEAMREGGRSSTTSRGHNRLRSGLVIAETAFGVTLLIGAGLLIRSFNRLVPRRSRLQSLRTCLPRVSICPRLATTPTSKTDSCRNSSTVSVCCLASPLQPAPFHCRSATITSIISFNLLDHPVPKDNEPSSGFYVVAPGFFETMQIPLVARPHF